MELGGEGSGGVREHAAAAAAETAGFRAFGATAGAPPLHPCRHRGINAQTYFRALQPRSRRQPPDSLFDA